MRATMSAGSIDGRDVEDEALEIVVVVPFLLVVVGRACGKVGLRRGIEAQEARLASSLAPSVSTTLTARGTAALISAATRCALGARSAGRSC